MYESVASGYLLHKYSDRVGRDVAEIPGLVDSELRRLRAQHKRNLELLKTMGTIVEQVIYENFKNRRNNSKLQGLIGAKQDGAIGPKSKAKSVQVVQDTIRDDLALKDRIYILEWDSVVANRIKDSVYASNILSTGYPMSPNRVMVWHQYALATAGDSSIPFGANPRFYGRRSNRGESMEQGAFC